MNAIALDWNGTVIDDALPCVHATNETLKIFDLPSISLEEYRAVYTVPINKVYQSFGVSKEDLETHSSELLEVWGRHYKIACADLQLRDGVYEALDALCTKGYKLAVLSNYTVEDIKAQAARFSVLDFFDDILANESLHTPFVKMAKGAFLKNYIVKHSLEKVVVVGDSVEEVEIAQQQNLVGVAVTGGVSAEDRLRASQPDYLIHSMRELPSVVGRAFSDGGAP